MTGRCVIGCLIIDAYINSLGRVIAEPQQVVCNGNCVFQGYWDRK